jgi:predicted transport protein
VYKELKELILSLSPSISIKVTKSYIAYVRNRTFVSMHTKRSWLFLHLGLKKGELGDPKNITIGTPSTEGHYDITHYSLKVNDKSDLGDVLTLIKTIL